MFHEEIAKLSNTVLKGMFHAPDLGLTLKFQFNPTEMTVKKDVNYETTDAPLYPTQILTWSGNSQKEIGFTLYFESSASGIASPSVVRRSLGVLGIEAILETLTLPSNARPFQKAFEAGNFIKNTIAPFTSGQGISIGSLTSALESSASNVLSSVSSEISQEPQEKRQGTFAPPDVFFIFGRRWFRGKIKGFDVTEKNFNRFLTPRYLETQIQFGVIEDGQFAEQQDNQRLRWAKLESSISDLEIKENIIESAAGFSFDTATSNLNVSSGTILEMPMDLGL